MLHAAEREDRLNTSAPLLAALVVDDDRDFRESLCLLVEREGFEVRQAGTLAEARERIHESPADVVLVDLGLPDGNGLELLRDENLATGSEFIVVTGSGSVDSAVEALREGALDYLGKPPDHARLKTVLAGVLRTREFKAEVLSLRGELRQLGRFGRLVGRSPAMQRVYDLIARGAPTQVSVFLTGESGTGKELAAETIHLLSRRRKGPFLAVNCGAVASTLIESELFGHERGSFTGADSHRRGYFEEARGGTLFLDEVGDMPIELQGRLLRVLETGTILRVGASEVIPVDVRVIAATNRDPARAVHDGLLREDLYYRLNAFTLSLPPLRDRREEIPVLLKHSMTRMAERYARAPLPLSPTLLQACHNHPWPGNLRELNNFLKRYLILGDENLAISELLPRNDGNGAIPGEPSRTSDAGGLKSLARSAKDEAEALAITRALEQTNWNRKQAAAILQISYKALLYKIRQYGIAESRGHHKLSAGA